MKTYSEKLRDPMWLKFREQVFLRLGNVCAHCGVDYRRINSNPQVHHKRYLPNHEPWEYEMGDLEVLCGSCHAEIHDCENRWRNMIRTLPPWATIELAEIADTLSQMEPQNLRQVAAKTHVFIKNLGTATKQQNKSRYD